MQLEPDRRTLLGSVSAFFCAGAEGAHVRRSSARPSTVGARAAVILLACIFVALALGVVARSGGGAVPSFRTAYIGTGNVCEPFAIGDLNGDRRPDVAVGCGSSGDFVGLWVYANRGSGRFREAGQYLTSDANPHEVTSVAIGDLDGDGNADLVAATGSISVLLNRGDGTFLRPVDYPGGDAGSVAIGDLDGDGKADLVAGNTNAVSVLLNRGGGTFPPPANYKTGRGGVWGNDRRLALGDLNGDGATDLVTQNSKDSTLSVLLNKGDGTFLPERHYATGHHPYSAALGDLNGDGKPDVATNGRTLSVLLNGGDGTLQPRRDTPVASNLSVALGDLNGDGKTDVAVPSERGIYVLLNRGDASFQPKLEYSSTDSVEAAIADLNGDKRADLASANFTLLRNDRYSSLAVMINTPGLCNVQYVVRMTLATAKRALARINCRVGKVSWAYSKVRKGRVISQKPKFGAVRPGGSKVNLVLSRGRRR
jgi:hypothetical protein